MSHCQVANDRVQSLWASAVSKSSFVEMEGIKIDSVKTFYSAPWSVPEQYSLDDAIPTILCDFSRFQYWW